MENLTEDELHLFQTSPIANALILLCNKIANQQLHWKSAAYPCYGNYGYRMSSSFDYPTDKHYTELVIWKYLNKKHSMDTLMLGVRLNQKLQDGCFEISHIHSISFDMNDLIRIHETIKFLIEEVQRDYEKYQGKLDIFKQTLEVAAELSE
jgi:hypothetical protein